MRRVLNHAHHVRNLNRAFLGDDKLNRRLVGVFGSIGIEVIVKQNRNFTGQAASVCRLLRNDRVVFKKLLIELNAGFEIVKRAA